MRKIAVAFAVILATGCTGNPYNISPANVDPAKYEVVGNGEGAATGIMLFQFIPIGQNSKLERAVKQAIAQRGGDVLVDANVTESWFWAWVLNGYKVRVNGTVLKLRR